MKKSIDPNRLLETVSSRWCFPDRVLDEISRDAECLQAYRAQVGVHHAFTLRTHTMRVMNCYERHFAQRADADRSERAAFRLFLALHDIGKPRAIAAGDKRRQHGLTVEMIQTKRASWPATDREVSDWIARVDGDPIGAYLKKEMSLSEAARVARSMLTRSSVAPEDFWQKLLMYYQCDVSAYTSRGGIMNSLDGLFEWDPTGEIRADSASGLLKFSEITGHSVRQLERAVFGESAI